MISACFNNTSLTLFALTFIHISCATQLILNRNSLTHFTSLLKQPNQTSCFACPILQLLTCFFNGTLWCLQDHPRRTNRGGSVYVCYYRDGILSISTFFSLILCLRTSHNQRRLSIWLIWYLNKRIVLWHTSLTVKSRSKMIIFSFRKLVVCVNWRGFFYIFLHIINYIFCYW